MDSERLKRSGRVLAPSLFTLGNMACGFYALVAAQGGDFDRSAACILGGIAFDMLDGRVARLVRGESAFGVEFDSLSDFLTFGVAPAYMMHAFLLKSYGMLGYWVAFFYAACGALRLARFNALAQSGKGSKTHFTGLPIPAGAGFLASFILLYDIVEGQKPVRTWHFLMEQIPWLAALGPLWVAGIGFLMISTVPYGAFKEARVPRGLRAGLVLAALAGVTAAYFYPQNALFLIFLAYALSGLIGLLRAWRKGARSAP